MNYHQGAFKLVLFLLLPFFSLAQIQVSFPTSRAVFQRDKSNQATIRIIGAYTSALTRVEARLQARDGQGTSIDWRTIQDNVSGGVYAGDISGSGGWYNLEVRGMNGDQQVGITTIERVGIGEVFIVAGQSNAQGIHQNAPNPANDRVNCVNYQYPADAFPNDPPVPVFTQLDNSPGFTIAPRGVGSWYWGQLGDLLVKRLNVPVMFFNAAFTGTAVQNWRQSAPDGGTAYSIYNGQPYLGRQPYINLKISLQFYANMLGLRAVLWHQGEADNLINTPTSQYISDLQLVINQTRHDYNRNMSWVIARDSYGDFLGGSDAAVIVAQDMVIGTGGNNTFAGPNTDAIQIPRKRPPLFDPDGLHFDYNGLIEVANAWNNSLNDSFFQNSTPIGPAAAPTISVACAGSNMLKISINGNYPTVQWESGESGNTITKGAGTYRAKIKDALGNTFFSAQVNVPNVVATIADNGQPYVCAGNSLNLTTNYSNVTWVNQQNNTTVASTQTFSTNSEGAFYVRYRDASGCDFTSNVINVSIKPLPATPTISNDKPTTFCQGDNTVLRTNTDNVRYNWSDGQQAKTINVGTSGSYFLTVTDQFGCTSARSNTIDVTANPVPEKPIIATSGPTTFCADRSLTLTAPINTTYQWTSGQTTQSITLNESGTYAVRTSNQFGCTSEQSDIVTVTVNPLPAPPSVSAEGATTFCDGNSVILAAESSLDVVWTSGQNDKVIVVTSSGNYAAQARDQIGCLSSYSTIIPVKVNALPNTPTILASPGNMICEGDKATLRVNGAYTVFWNTGDSTQYITTDMAGTYSAKVRDVNGCVSAQAGSITIELKPLPEPPTISIVGTYTLEAISASNGTEFRWYRGTDSLATQSATIKASQSGLYTARSSIIYSPTLTCFSRPSEPISFTVDLTNNGLSVYPNPNPNKVVTLETQVDLVNATITILTVNGQEVFKTTVPALNERKQLTLLDLSPGTYLLRVQAVGFDASKRILLGL